MEFTNEETMLLNNVLNDVCYGMPINDHVKSVGAPLADCVALLERLDYRAGGAIRDIEFSSSERALLENCIRYALDYLGHEEFATRVGTEYSAGARLLARFGTSD